ncbi:murein biosynthesis integral membrane protein MurJ [Plasticicumulans lactativorans]|nr:murein biosynthesis integral membrane protein MurJ [Plasticicumulans lactativorans]
MRPYLRATALIASLTLAANLLGFVREILFARAFGAAGVADVFVSAFSIAAVCFLIFSAGSLQGAFMPRYQRALVQNASAQAYGLWRKTLHGLTLLLLAIAMALWLGADFWVALVLPGFDAERQALTAQMLHWLAPMVVMAGLGSLLQSVLHAHQRFFLPALIPVLNNIVLIVFLLLVVPTAGIVGLAQGTLLGAAVALVLVPQVRAVLPRCEPEYSPGALRELVGAMLPLVFLLVADQVSALIQKALVSDLAPGSIAVLNYAARLEGLPIGIFAAAVAAVFFPALVEALSRGSAEEARSRFALGLGLVCFCMIPAMIFLLCESRLIVRVLFERGAFDAEATSRAAAALVYYAIGLLPQSFIVLLNRIYFAAGDTRTPMHIGVLSALLHVGVCWVLVETMGYLGIALGTSVYALIYAVLLSMRLKGVLQTTPDLWWKSVWRALVAGTLMAMLYQAWDFPESISGLLLALSSGTVLYCLAAWILRDPVFKWRRPGIT